MPYGDVLALVRGRTTHVDQLSTSTRDKRFSLGRALMTGGLVLSKTTTKHTQTLHDDSEQVLYLIRRDGREPMILRERRLRHDGLGADIRPTAGENFSQVVSMLRARAPRALYDDRMVAQRRAAQVVRAIGTPAEGKTTVSNSHENDLVAHLIAIAHRSGQL
jgi:hypothetical protein